MPSSLPRHAALAAAIGLVPAAAFSQTPDATGSTVTERAADAFGERVGLDRGGLYSEAQVRGFDLQGNGAYRIEGAYFSRAAGLSDSISTGATVQVGAAAARQDQPSPSGVINHQLRDPAAPISELIVGVREFDTWQLEAVRSWSSADGRFAAVAHTLLRPEMKTWLGGEGHAYDLGGVLQWRPAPATRLRAFAGGSRQRYTGEIQVRAADGGLPPPLEAGVNYAPAWAVTEYSAWNLGVLADHTAGPWRLDASAFRSVYDGEHGDIGLLEITGAGDVVRTGLLTGPSRTVSDSGELRLSRDLLGTDLRQRFGIAFRGRRTQTDIPGTSTATQDRFRLSDGPPQQPPPRMEPPAPVGRDLVEQTTFTVSYAAQWRDRVDVRAGAHRTRYDKTVTPTIGAATRGVEEIWLYNASLTVRPTERMSLFGSYVTGLEETGIAPAAAVNRGAVLPPVRSRQYELGAAYAFGPDVSLIAAVFDIEKPINGLRSDGVFGPIGEVRHRGVEASLRARVGKDTSFLLGAVWNDPTLSASEVESGQVNETPPGVSPFTATFSVDHRLAFAPDWSVDAFYLYESGRRVDSRSDLRAPQVPFVTLGTRWRFSAGGRSAQLRLQLLNAFGREGYYATPSELLVRVSPRTWRALLTLPLP